MQQTVRLLFLVAVPWLLLGPGGPAPAGAQPPMAPVPVGVTAARQASVSPIIALTGTVASQRQTLVASEVAGLVMSLEARDGDRVRRGAPIVRLRRESLSFDRDAARARLQEAEARLALAARSHTRARELFDSGVISQQELDNAISESDAWQGRVDQAKAEIAGYDDDLERSIVRAPFAGVVVAEHCQVGAWLAIGAPVVEMMDLDALEVVVDVPERYFADTRPGIEARVTFSALADLDVSGTVSAVIPRANPQARTFPVKVRIANVDGRIGVGMLASVALPAGIPEPVVLVPKDAVVTQGDQRIVYVVTDGDGGPTVAPRPVALGTGAGPWIAAAGIAAEERVVTRGNERLMPGMNVAPEPVEYPAP